MRVAGSSDPKKDSEDQKCVAIGRRIRRLNTAPPVSHSPPGAAAAAKEESAPEATPEVQPPPKVAGGAIRCGSLHRRGSGDDYDSSACTGNGTEADRFDADADLPVKGPPKRRSLRRASTDPRGVVADVAKNETLSLLEAGLRQVSPQGVGGLARHVSMENAMDDSLPHGPASPRQRRQSRHSSDTETTSVAGAASCTPSLAPESPAVHWLVPQLLFALSLGAVLGTTTVAFHLSTAKIGEYQRRAATALAAVSIGPAAVHGGGFLARAVFGAYMACGTFLAASISSWVSQRLAPECVGGGTIATKICLAVGSPVPLRVGAWRFALSALYVGAGNVLGIEAPTLHLCASVASALHRLACLLSERVLRCASSEVKLSLFTDEGLPQAVVLGCAAGLSAAFGSPLAAISYAVEEYVDVRQTGMVTALVLLSSLSAALVSRSSEPHVGPGSLSITSRGTPAAASVPPAATGVDSTAMLPWLLVATIIGLTLGTLSHVVMSVVLRLRAACQARCNMGLEIGFGALAGLVAGALSWGVYVATACDSAWGLRDLARFDRSCDAMQGDSASLGEQAAVALLLSAGKLVAFSVCFATGGAGGVLMPSLVIGTSLGRCVGLVTAQLDPALPAAGAVLGMAAFFSANMRLPLTAAGVALECATAMGNYDPRLVCTIPLASALGTWVAAWWDPCSIFERMMMQDGINPFTLSQQIQVMLHGTDSPGLLGNEWPQHQQQRRDSRGSLIHGPLAPPVLPLDRTHYGESQASTRIVMAARRRSILTELRTGPSTSIFSSPDEFLFASTNSKRRVYPQHGGQLSVLPASTKRARSSVPARDASDCSDAGLLPSSLFPGIGSLRSSRSSALSAPEEPHSRRSEQDQTRPSCRSTAAFAACRGSSQQRPGGAATASSRTDTPDSVSDISAPQTAPPTLLGCVQADPKAQPQHGQRG